MEPSEPANESKAGANIQRLAIGAGTLIVVVLTIVVALILASRDLPDGGTATPVSLVTATFTPAPLLTDTPALTPTPSFTSLSEEPTATPTGSATDTPTVTPLPPTATVTPIVETTPTDTPAPPPPPESGDPCPPREGWQKVEVQVGDSWDTLARRTGLSVVDLLQANCSQPTTLRPGDVINLPFLPENPRPTETLRPDPVPTATIVPVVPRVDSVAPVRIDEDVENEVIITVVGQNFRVRESGFRVELRGALGSVPLELRQVSLSDTNFDAIVPPGLPSGTYDLVVMNASDRAGVKADALVIGPPPTETPTPTLTPTSTPTPTPTP